MHGKTTLKIRTNISVTQLLSDIAQGAQRGAIVQRASVTASAMESQFHDHYHKTPRS
jgi:hypothetical protein